MPPRHSVPKSRFGLALGVGATLIALTGAQIASAATHDSSGSNATSNRRAVHSSTYVATAAKANPPIRYRALPLVKPHRGGNVVYLTFDDGPNRVWTPRILALLKRYHARATFFVIGRNVRSYPTIVTAETKAGHGVQNHSNTHPNLRRIHPDTVLAYRQISPVNSLIRRLTGHIATCLRPPYGSFDLRVRKIAGGLGLRLALWTLDTVDWSHPGVPHIVRVGMRARGGSIVLMHDGVGGVQTYRALGRILAGLSKRGYVFRALC